MGYLCALRISVFYSCGNQRYGWKGVRGRRSSQSSNEGEHIARKGVSWKPSQETLSSILSIFLITKSLNNTMSSAVSWKAIWRTVFDKLFVCTKNYSDYIDIYIYIYVYMSTCLISNTSDISTYISLCICLQRKNVHPFCLTLLSEKKVGNIL